MVEYKCEKCNKIFSKKSTYVNHGKRKTSCIKDENVILNDIVNRHKCLYCNNDFSRIDILKNHMKLCEKAKEEMENKDKEIIQLKKENKKIKNKNDERIDKFLKHIESLEKENKDLKKQVKKYSEALTNLIPNTNNININITNNNNNVNLYGFGKEDWKSIDPKYFVEPMSNNKIKSEDIFKKITENIYFNPKYPEYHNIQMSSNPKYCLVYNQKGWIPEKIVIINRLIENVIKFCREKHHEINTDDFSKIIFDEKLENVKDNMVHVDNLEKVCPKEDDKSMSSDEEYVYYQNSKTKKLREFYDYVYGEIKKLLENQHINISEIKDLDKDIFIKS